MSRELQNAIPTEYTTVAEDADEQDPWARVMDGGGMFALPSPTHGSSKRSAHGESTMTSMFQKVFQAVHTGSSWKDLVPYNELLDATATTQEELAAVEQVLEWAAARGLSKRNEAGTAVALRRRAEAGPATAEPAATPTPRDMQGAESL